MAEKTGKIKGIFLVFEGIDGCGKSTQAKMLAAWFEKQGKKTVLTYEPYTAELRKTLRGNEKSKQEWLKLFTEDRKVHLKEVILPALKQGKVIISDRYYHSTLAYQLPEREWKGYASKFLQPELVFVFDLPVDLGLGRTIKRYEQNKDSASVFEKKAVLEKVRQNYLKLPKYFKNVIILDATASINEIFAKVMEKAEKFFQAEKI
jgi:dTMP kinase